ncbi:MAG: type I pullulanase, partial [Streptococcus mitis]|nr:type I pullulanase [Streptococcus mitis]
MLNYPVVIHFHRKNGDYAACSFSRKQADNVEKLYYENNFFGAKFSFTVTSQEKLENLKFSVEIDGTVKEYSVRYNYYPLLTEVWILEGDETVYYSENPAIASPYYKDQNPFAFDRAIHSASFDHHWGYQGELGYSLSDYQTSFKLWAPTATAVQVVVYENTSNDAPIWKTFNLERGNSYNARNI